MKSLFDTLNIVYGEKEKRRFLKLNAVSLSFTLAGISCSCSQRWEPSWSFRSPSVSLASRTSPT